MRNIQVRNTSTLHSHLVPYISCKQTAKLPVIASYIYYIKLKSCLSVCLSDRHAGISAVSTWIEAGLAQNES